MRTNVYIDGFNFYYGCVKGTPHKWLNFGALCRLIFPAHQINHIRYFTARVHAPPGDPQKPQRQATYLRALQTVPGLSIHYGTFLSHVVKMPLANPTPGGPLLTEVIKTEEKGSDVNLATHLLVDGFQQANSPPACPTLTGRSPSRLAGKRNQESVVVAHGVWFTLPARQYVTWKAYVS